MSMTLQLTGKTRYREQKRWFCRTMLVLQVEERAFGISYNPYGKGLPVDALYWRDATVSDIKVSI